MELTFTAIADNRTRVALEHRGWAALGERAEAAHRNYDPGCDLVFGRHFGDFTGT